MTYSSESWDPTKKEEERIQKIFNTAIKTTMNLPQGTPTTILLKETGFIHMKQGINLKRIVQARRVEEKTERSLIKDNTTDESTWVKKTMEIMEKIPPTEVAPQAEKRSTKENNQTTDQREVGRGNKNGDRKKIKHWNDLTTNINTKRPEYMGKLTRRESQAMLRARTSIMNVRMNYNNGH